MHSHLTFTVRTCTYRRCRLKNIYIHVWWYLESRNWKGDDVVPVYHFPITCTGPFLTFWYKKTLSLKKTSTRVHPRSQTGCEFETLKASKNRGSIKPRGLDSLHRHSPTNKSTAPLSLFPSPTSESCSYLIWSVANNNIHPSKIFSLFVAFLGWVNS